MSSLKFEGLNVFYQISPVFALAKEEKTIEDKEGKEETPEIKDNSSEANKKEEMDSATVEKTPEMEGEPAEKEEADEGAEEIKKEESETEAPTEKEAIPEGEMPVMGEMPMDNMGMDGMMGVETKPTLMQMPAALIGITSGVLALGILCGIGLAKLKIKKGINLYED